MGKPVRTATRRTQAPAASAQRSADRDVRASSTRDRRLLALQHFAGNRAVGQRLSVGNVQRQPSGKGKAPSATPATTLLKGAAAERLSKLGAAWVTLSTNLAEMNGEREQFAGSFEMYGRQITDNLSKGLNDVIGFGVAADVGRLDRLRPSLIGSIAGEPREAATEEGIKAGGELVRPGVIVTRRAKTATHIRFTGVPKLAKFGAGVVKAAPVINFVLTEAVAVFDTIEANARIDEAMSLARAQGELQTEADEAMVSFLNSYVFTKGSVLHQLKQYESRGETLSALMEAEQGELQHAMRELTEGRPISAQTTQRRLKNVGQLIERRREWAAGFAAARQRAAEAIGRMPDAMDNALGVALVKYEALGGDLPRGTYQAKVARYRLAQRVVGQRGEISPSGRGVEIGQWNYPLWKPLRPYVRSGQLAVVTRVRYGQGLKPDLPNYYKWTDDMFELEVELGGFPTVVPSVVGLEMREAAKRVAVDAGLEPHFVERASGIRAGFALGIDPPPGTRLASGSRVTITVSSGQAPGERAPTVPNVTRRRTWRPSRD